MVRIPAEYQEVEYIESTGTQYFWTDIDIQDGLTVDSVQTMATGNDSYLFGGQCESGVVSGKTCFNGSYSNRINRVQGAFTNNYYLVGTVVQDNQTKYHIVSTHADNKRICIVNDVSVLNSQADTFVATTGKCVCFGWNKAGTPANFYKGKVYSLKVSKADTLLANYIPCYRKSDNEIGMYDTVSKTFFTNQGTRTFLKGNDVTYDTVNLMESRRRILLNTPHIESLTGSALSFKTDMASKLKECRIHFTPVQEGSGDPSPDNVRPIHGWDGVTVTRCGKNLIPSLSDTDFWERNAYINKRGSVINSSRYKMCDYKPALPNKDYRFTSSSSSWVGIGFYDSSYAPLNFIEHKGGKVSLISPNNAKYYRLYAQNNVYDLYLETSDSVDNHVDYPTSSFTDYEPYTAQSLTIPFPQTIYGGYVDLVKGEVVEEWIANDMGLFTWRRSWNAFVCRPTGIATHSGTGTTVKVLSEIYKSGRVSSATGMSVNKTIQGRNGYDHTCIEDNDYNAVVSDFKEGITGYKMAYTLATPNSYPIDPVAIRTLKGLNNIWSDANGNIELKFWTH